MSSRSHRLRILIGIAAAALIAAGCGATADDAPGAVGAADAPAAVETSAPAEPSAAVDGETTIQADWWAISAPRSIPADAVGTPRKDLEAGMPAAVSAALAKAYYAFPDIAVMAIAPDLLAVWGIGPPRGGRAAAVEIWWIERGGATPLAAVELPPGGALQDGGAIRIWPGGTARRAWLEVRLELSGEAGGERYDLLLWDGSELRRVFERSDAAPGSTAQLRDLDGDGDPEIVLDRSEPDRFYAASGIGVGDAAVLRLAGDRFREVRSGAPDATLGAAARDEALAALDYAEAGLWRMAMERAETAAQLALNNPQLMWNAIVINERGAAALRAASRVRLHWLALLLAGDWSEAVEHFRALPLASQIDAAEALRGTPLAGYESGVAELVRARATQALSAAHRLSAEQAAPIYLMRGLARWWLGYGVLSSADDLVEAIAGYAPQSIVYDLLWVIGYRGG